MANGPMFYGRLLIFKYTTVERCYPPSTLIRFIGGSGSAGNGGGGDGGGGGCGHGGEF